MVVNHSQGSYQILFSPFVQNGEMIVTDSNVIRHYPWIKEHPHIVVQAGEKSKSVEQYAQLCGELLNKRVNRKTTLVAFGGGVIGDLVGFAAATYMRGIPFIQVPTTLLSQVDSSVGGKVGVDLPEGKNLIGAFYPPQRVHIDCSLLKTLDPRQTACGMAEVIKYAWIMDPDLLPELDTVNEIEPIVKKCIELKVRVVEEDEFEQKGIRAWLNFGHTIGHAIEQITNYEVYTHGEAISIGMVVEAKIAEKLGQASENLSAQVAKSLRKHDLPTEYPPINSDDLINVMLRDKKSVDGSITMSLVSKLGTCKLVPNIAASIVKEALEN